MDNDDRYTNDYKVFCREMVELEFNEDYMLQTNAGRQAMNFNGLLVAAESEAHDKIQKNSQALAAQEKQFNADVKKKHAKVKNFINEVKKRIDFTLPEDRFFIESINLETKESRVTPGEDCVILSIHFTRNWLHKQTPQQSDGSNWYMVPRYLELHSEHNFIGILKTQYGAEKIGFIALGDEIILDEYCFRHRNVEYEPPKLIKIELQ